MGCPRWQQGSPLGSPNAKTNAETETGEEIVGMADAAEVTPEVLLEDLPEDLDAQDLDPDPDATAAE
ncbi:MAG: hypothetical protein HC924_06295 [Synechococcaceae cyanobacterium SM2_3_2]|nr:hypothetical protein [Synechococcaceae cyanobacterium SM2_3_2]